MQIGSADEPVLTKLAISVAISKPSTNRIPEIILLKIAEQGHTVKSYCEKLGHNKAWLLHLYSGESAMSRYQRVAQILKISIDELVEAIESRTFSDIFETRLGKPEYFTSIWDLANRARVSRGFLRELCKNSGDLKAISSLVILARDLKLSIEEVCPVGVLEDFVA